MRKLRASSFALPIVLPFALPLAFVLSSTEARAATTVAVDPSSEARPISPLIYGFNFASASQIDAAKLTLTRWGGNGTSRYNYEIDVSNTGADYFFENIPGCFGAQANYCNPAPTDPKDQSGANAFLTEAQAKGVTALVTIPTIGWVAKAPPKYAHPFDCGCPKTAIATQDSFDPYDTNCGDGKQGGNFIACPAPTTTSVAVTPDWAKTWVTYLVSKFGPSNGKRIYQLDNEPALWSSTHHDVHPTKLSYDELWQRMRDYAVAILAADPTALIAGPVEWGWPNYFCSDADNVSQGCSATSPDRAAHGGVELVAWLLDQAKAYEQQNGKRILHFLDLHYYPQGGTPPEITRSLWDPAYTDPSWINDKIRLLPRMRDWVSQHYPGTKISVSEYDFYHHTEAAGAIAYAEVLGIFGREGLDAATAWSPPADSDAAFGAYKLYRNYDGAGGAFEAVSVHAGVTSGDAGTSSVRAYAAAGAKRVTVALVNESAAAESTTLSFGNFTPAATASLYVLGAGSAITKQPDVAIQGGKASVTLAPTSIAMLVVAGDNPNDLPDAGSGFGDAGSPPGDGGASTTRPDGGSSDDGGANAASGGGDSSGCACRVGAATSTTTTTTTTAGVGAIFAGALALVSRRRRRVRRATRR